ncbi:4-hydroxyphenylpyruvate dioxygenase [Actinomadura keratinilytica]|jgi:4-hydroxymandelate synthase|uniref:4-hydroxyphenylpyruvate dioxygenase n=1 Tax=Actinomadura keratinilytica TaxID=547461 RepID=A0ABP7YTS8_9ACTN
MKIDSIDHVELYVEDAEGTAGRLCDSFGFAVAGRGGPDTGLQGCRTILLRQREITLLVTEALDPAHRAAEYVQRHGDGVAVIGLAVDDARAAFATALERGAEPVSPPEESGPEGARVTFASVTGFGDVEHRFASREASYAPFAPGVIDETGDAGASGLLQSVDHVAVCVPAGELDGLVRRYLQVFGFDKIFEERIVVGSQAMDSKVVQSSSGNVTFTILEPDTTRAPGQIDEFVANHDGAGVQHLAFLTADIAAAVRDCTDRGVRFLTTPDAYYDALSGRLGSADLPVDTLRELNILADRDSFGEMLQIFTESTHPRRTLFWELIERRGAQTFGSNNIKALYEAVERRRAADQHAGS